MTDKAEVNNNVNSGITDNNAGGVSSSSDSGWNRGYIQGNTFSNNEIQYSGPPHLLAL
jgi:hypothetical protein